MVLTPFKQAAMDGPALLATQVASIPLTPAAKPEEIGRFAVFLA
jgi:glucose 1-dehydrogenase